MGLALADSTSGTSEITSADSIELATSQHEPTNSAAELARLVVRDDKGVTKIVTVDVQVIVLVFPSTFGIHLIFNQGTPTYGDTHKAPSAILINFGIGENYTGQRGHQVSLVITSLWYPSSHRWIFNRPSWGNDFAATGPIKANQPPYSVGSFYPYQWLPNSSFAD